VADPVPEGQEGRKHWRKMKRQDTGIELFRRALAELDALDRLKPILFELSRLYNPLIDGPLVDRDTYSKILSAVEAGLVDEAQRLLDGRLALYAPGDDGASDAARWEKGAGPFYS
jgi:hypothetical protein